MTKTSYPPALMDHINRLNDWVHRVLLDQWLPNVWPEEFDLCAESLQQTSPHRTLVACRQIYTLSHLTQRYPKAKIYENHLQSAAFHLHPYFFDPALNGWNYSIIDTNTPYDDTRDLYTYAFVLFAYATLDRHFKGNFYQGCAQRVWLDIKNHFKDPMTGLFHSKMSSDFSQIFEKSLQNPHMHLFEALIALHQAGIISDQIILDTLNDIKKTFYSTPLEAILEYPCDQKTGNRIEPGHQFEWVSLLLTAKQSIPQIDQIFSDSMIKRMLTPHPACSSSYPFLPLSIDSQTQQVLDPRHRIWTQCEWIKALHLGIQTWGNVVGEFDMIKVLEDVLKGLHEGFLNQTGWSEIIDTQRNTLRDDQPASTPYHIISCLNAIKPITITKNEEDHSYDGVDMRDIISS